MRLGNGEIEGEGTEEERMKGGCGEEGGEGMTEWGRSRGWELKIP